MHVHTVCDMGVFRRKFEAILPAELPIHADDPARLDNLGVLKHAFILSRDAIDLRDEAMITAEVAEFRAAGGRAMVDMSTPGNRCHLGALQRVSEAAGVHLAATTGLYAEDSWPERFRGMTIDQYRDLMHRALSDGADIRAYHHWSTMDTLEYQKGFGTKYGLIDVDLESRRKTRRLRRSGKMYAEIAAAGGITRAIVEEYVADWSPESFPAGYSRKYCIPGRGGWL